MFEGRWMESLMIYKHMPGFDFPPAPADVAL
jgi:hypothetical protein